jgi:hypothetical protein
MAHRAPRAIAVIFANPAGATALLARADVQPMGGLGRRLLKHGDAPKRGGTVTRRQPQAVSSALPYRMARRSPDPPAASIGVLHRQPHGRWVWAICHRCTHRSRLPLAPLLIRWGPDTSSDVLRSNLKCTACGHKGNAIQVPSFVDIDVDAIPFHIRPG